MYINSNENTGKPSVIPYKMTQKSVIKYCVLWKRINKSVSSCKLSRYCAERSTEI